MIRCTAVGMPHIIFAASSQLSFLFFNPSMKGVQWWHVTLKMIYFEHCQSSQVFSHAVVWKLDVFLSSGVRKSILGSFISYTR
jgi:hypothetical protein